MGQDCCSTVSRRGVPVLYENEVNIENILIL